jgi:allantoin racemase
MRIWHQSLTVLGQLPAYEERMRVHIQKVVRPDTEVVLHGMLPGTYPGNYPGDDIAFKFMFTMHSTQWAAHALNAENEGFDAFAMCSLPDPMLSEVRSLVDIPVIGCGETCFHLATMYGQRFGMLLFIDRMAARYLQQIKEHGLAGHCVGVEPVGFSFNDVLESFGSAGQIVDRFRVAARRMIAAGADVIIPGEIPLNVLLASEGISRIDDVPLLDSLAVTLKMAEMMVDLKASTGLSPSRRGWESDMPPRKRVLQVMDFYGLGRHLTDGTK